METIFIVEDEQKVKNFLVKGLEETGYSTITAADGTGAVSMFGRDFDLLILDNNLPGITGFDVCKTLRRSGSDVPVLMLTALGTTDDKLNGFDAGADDYLVKPFEFQELLARVRALLRRSRSRNENQSVLKIADLELDTYKRIARRGGNLIELTAKEYSLLEFLMNNPGRVLSRAQIAEKIWDINFDTGTNVIDVYINFLRKKIDKGYSPKLIHTMIGAGYILKEGEQ